MSVCFTILCRTIVERFSSLTYILWFVDLRVLLQNLLFSWVNNLFINYYNHTGYTLCRVIIITRKLHYEHLTYVQNKFVW